MAACANPPAEYRVYVNFLQFSKDGQQLVEGGAVRWQSAKKELADFSVTLFDVQTGRLILRAPNEALESVTQDGNHFVTTPQLPATDGGLRLRAIADGHLLGKYQGNISISPDGSPLVTMQGRSINTPDADVLTTFHVEKPPQ